MPKTLRENNVQQYVYEKAIWTLCIQFITVNVKMSIVTNDFNGTLSVDKTKNMIKYFLH